MKPISLILGMLAASLPTQLHAQSGTYKILGQVAELSVPAQAYLNRGRGKEEETDSTPVVKGRYSFTGKITQPALAYISIIKKGQDKSGRQDVLELYLEPGQLTLNSKDSISTSKISAGPVNVENRLLNIALAPTVAKGTALNKEYEAAPDEKKKSVVFMTHIDSVSDEIDKEQKVIFLSFIKAHPDSFVSLSALARFGGYIPDTREVEPVFLGLSSRIRATSGGIAYAAKLEKLKKFEVGSIAPDFTESDTSGKAVSLHDFKGKYVLVDFWASWCGPCRRANPAVVAAYNRHKNRNFTILGVSLDGAKGREKWIAAIHKDQLPWTQISDLKGWQNETAQLYMVQAIPQNYLIGPDGKIVAKNIDSAVLDKTLDGILAN